MPFSTTCIEPSKYTVAVGEVTFHNNARRASGCACCACEKRPRKTTRKPTEQARRRTLCMEPPAIVRTMKYSDYRNGGVEGKENRACRRYFSRVLAVKAFVP